MRTLTLQEIINIEKALTNHINYRLDFNGVPASLDGVPMMPYSANSSTPYLRVMDFISIHNNGSMSQKVSFTLDLYFNHVGVSNLKEALKRLKDIEDTKQIQQGL